MLYSNLASLSFRLHSNIPDLFFRERAEGIIWVPLTKPTDEEKLYASGPKELFSSAAPPHPTKTKKEAVIGTNWS